MGPDKALRGLEAGTKAGALLLVAAVGFLLWKWLGPKALVRTDIPDPAPPVPPNAPPPPAQQAGGADIGITTGGLVSSVHARIIDPAKGARVYRRTARAVFPAVLELANEGVMPFNVIIDVVLSVYEYSGTERPGVRTTFGPFILNPGSVVRYDVEIDSGNVNSALFEFGQGDAIANVFTNGKLTQTTSFEVW